MRSGSKTILRALNLGLDLDGKALFKDLSFHLEEGEVLAFVGPNGSGKTSLVLAIAGLIEHRGEIRLFGRRIREFDRAGLARLIGVLPDEPDLQFVSNRVDDEVAFALENLGYSPSLIRERVYRWLDRFGILNHAEDSILRLSGGQRQRVALASLAAVEERRLIIADNPWANLDPPTSELTSNLLREMASEGRGVIVTAHSEDKVRFADRIVKLGDSEGQPRIDLEGLRSLIGPREREVSVTVRIKRFSYGGSFALQGVRLRFGTGEPICVLGRNGAGKSTLGRIVAGLLRCRGCEVLVNGGKPGRGVSTYVFQQPEKQFLGKTPLEDLSLSLKAAGVKNPVELSKKLLLMGGFRGLMDAGVWTLGRGHRRLLTILSAIALDPKVMVVDEPTLGLDPYHSRLVEELLAAVSRRSALMVATHDLELARRLCSRAVVLRDGKVVYEGDPGGLEIGCGFQGGAWSTP